MYFVEVQPGRHVGMTVYIPKIFIVIENLGLDAYSDLVKPDPKHCGEVPVPVRLLLYRYRCGSCTGSVPVYGY
jgi:hypothetical protein